MDSSKFKTARSAALRTHVVIRLKTPLETAAPRLIRGSAVETDGAPKAIP